MPPRPAPSDSPPERQKVRAVGSRAQVWHGMARHTSGNLTKADLKKNRAGRIVSVKASERAASEQRLQKAGYTTKKGQFRLFPPAEK